MELPEITILASQMMKELSGKRVSEVEVMNPKCLNMARERFYTSVVGRTIESVRARGKWVFISLEDHYVLLFNSGMGADVTYVERGSTLTEKYHIRLGLEDGTGFTIRVWSFCYLHLLNAAGLGEHKLTAGMGLTPLDADFTLGHFRKLLTGRKGNVKSFLLNQRNVAGIGNVYIQDILFDARVHPMRAVSSLTDTEVEALHGSMRAVMSESIRMGGLAYEKDFYGTRGGYGKEQFKVAYKPGEPCPICKKPVQKIRTGSTSSFICPSCQPLGCT
jgi:formamidopyrimidine-DNA glycosylase